MRKILVFLCLMACSVSAVRAGDAVPAPVPDTQLEQMDQTAYELDPHTVFCWGLLQDYQDLLDLIIPLQGQVQALIQKSLNGGLSEGELTQLLALQTQLALLQQQASDIWLQILSGGCLLVPAPNQP